MITKTFCLVLNAEFANNEDLTLLRIVVHMWYTLQLLFSMVK